MINVALSDQSGIAKLHVQRIFPSSAKISHARIIEETTHADEYRDVQTDTLDGILKKNYLRSPAESPYLLKIDVDGVEQKIIAGSHQTLKETNVVIVEVGFDNIIERSLAVIEQGFTFFDFVDPCYYDSRFAQADLIFLSNRAIKNLNIEMYNGPFDIGKWENYIALSD